jgi:hypothetical protein
MDQVDARIEEPASGETGYRGAKPSFGAVRLDVGKEGVSYSGDSVTAVVLAGIGLAAVIFSSRSSHS